MIVGGFSLFLMLSKPARPADCFPLLLAGEGPGEREIAGMFDFDSESTVFLN
jgi:hypothetical protein